MQLMLDSTHARQTPAVGMKKEEVLSHYPLKRELSLHTNAAFCLN
jgi:hypothetical protein